METLYSLDIVVIVYATNHIDMTTTHLYNQKLSDSEVEEATYEQVKLDRGEDALEGFEVLSIVR